MPTDAAQLATIKTQTLAIIATITAVPKPTYSIDGQTVSWGEYLQQLQETVAWCDRQLAGEEPFEIHSLGYSA
jgi:hypothetical protein